MKRKVFWIVGVLGVLSFFTSCEDDKEDQFSGIVESIEIWDGQVKEGFAEFFYDSEMRLIKYCDSYLSEDEDRYYMDTAYFSYTANKVTCIYAYQMLHNHDILESRATTWENVHDTIVYTLEKGKAVSYEEITTGESWQEKINLNYHAGELISILGERSGQGVTFTWENGNIIRKGEQEGPVNYKVSEALNNANIDLNALFSSLLSAGDEEVVFASLAGLLGNRCKNIILDDEEELLVFETKDNYMVKVTFGTTVMTIKYK